MLVLEQRLRAQSLYSDNFEAERNYVNNCLDLFFPENITVRSSTNPLLLSSIATVATGSILDNVLVIESPISWTPACPTRSKRDYAP